MAVLEPLLSLLGVEIETATASLRRHAVVWGAVAVFGLFCLVFLLVAADAALAMAVGPIVAPLLIALGAGLIALAIYVISLIQDGITARRDAERRRTAETSALVTTAIVSTMPVILKSSLMREIGIPVGAALASALLLRKAGRRDSNPKS